MTDAEAKMFAVSAAYERFMGRWSRLLAPLHIAFAGLERADRVLDVGAGTGSLASALVQAGVREVAGVDPSEGFVAYARQNAGAGPARFEVGDAQALRFEDASFDKSMSLLVMNFVPDHERAIAGMRRVTRAGGSVSACVWDYGGGMQMLRFFSGPAGAYAASLPEDRSRQLESRLRDRLLGGRKDGPFVLKARAWAVRGDA
jgi:SAM-dependent methyltransferase